MTTILLIRHGQTSWNAAGRWQGHTDVPLNDVGRKQARLLAQRLAAWPWPVAKLYSSDLQRAAETASIVGGALDLEPVQEPAWRERYVGAFQGLTDDEIAEEHPEAWAALRRGVVAPPGGESSRALHERVTGAFERLVEQHRGAVVAVISHGGAIRTLIAHVLQLPADRDPRISVRGNTGISIIEKEEEWPPILVRLNDTGHLE
ncbi:MAG: histidine phosphatase family protein [Candidatus Promineifilaceae bacterium]|nr:histidine phosphatase family protein [Candidatus Promineifilaceae bacterium]